MPTYLELKNNLGGVLKRKDVSTQTEHEIKILRLQWMSNFDEKFLLSHSVTANKSIKFLEEINLTKV